MKANITLTQGRSYWVGSKKFVAHKQQSVEDPKLISYCQRTAGFSVHILEDKKIMQPVEPPKAAKKAKASTEK